MSSRRRQGTANSLRLFKKRLRWIVQTTGTGTQSSFAKAMAVAGVSVDQTTVSRWLDEDAPYSPNVVHLMAISEIKPELSIDWLIGRVEADSLEEQYIESKIR